MVPGLSQIEKEALHLEEILSTPNLLSEWLELASFISRSENVFLVIHKSELLDHVSSHTKSQIELPEMCQDFHSSVLKALDQNWMGISLHNQNYEPIRGSLFIYQSKHRLEEISSALSLLVKQIKQFLMEKMENLRLSDRLEHLIPMREASTLLETLTDLAPAGIFFTDANGRATYLNKRWTEMTGLSFEEATQGKSYLAFHEDDRQELFRCWAQAVEKLEDFRHEFRIKNVKTGKIYNVITMTTPLKNTHQELIGYVGINIDITELKMAQAQAEEANRAKSVFLAGMSHEIRTPLHSIIGYADLLLERIVDEDQKTFATALAKSSDHLLSLINDVLDLSKIESGSITFKKFPLQFKDITLDLKQMFYLRCQEKNLQLLITIEDAELVYLGDSTRISQVLVNLLGNAFKFTERGEIRLSIERNKTTKKGNILIRVKDTGPGISKSAQSRVFETFYQESSSQTGSGLGLAIAKQLVKLMGGEIWLESELGAGTTFSFTLNLEEVKLEHSYQQPAEASELLPKKEFKSKILIVDDSLENRTLMKAFLKNSVYELEFAENGQEALGLMKQETYPLVFMDIQMPVMNGQETVHLYREWEKSNRQQRSAIIALSACGLTEEIAEAFKVGCDDYLVKPAKKEKILTILRNWVS